MFSDVINQKITRSTCACEVSVILCRN